jgi:hypothetical protein
MADSLLVGTKDQFAPQFNGVEPNLMGSNPLLSQLEMFEKWRDPMFIDTAHHHYRLRLEIDAFVGAASSRDFGRFMSALRR